MMKLDFIFVVRSRILAGPGDSDCGPRSDPGSVQYYTCLAPRAGRRGAPGLGLCKTTASQGTRSQASPGQSRRRADRVAKVLPKAAASSPRATRGMPFSTSRKDSVETHRSVAAGKGSGNRDSRRRRFLRRGSAWRGTGAYGQRRSHVGLLDRRLVKMALSPKSSCSR